MNKIQITSAGGEACHSHRSTELIYVLTGQAKIHIRGEDFQAFPKDVILINPEEPHGWSGHKGALVCKIYMDYYVLKNALKQEPFLFLCNSVREPEKDYGRIRYILETILSKYAEAPDGFWVESLYYALWEGIKTQYLAASPGKTAPVGDKIGEVMDYIQTSYGQPLNLAETAARWYMSESAFSRFFKRETGTGFTEYVRNLRLEQAKEQLLSTNKTVTEIAYDCGYSNLSVFNKNFRQAFSLSPKQFRQERNTPVQKMNASDLDGLAAYLKDSASYKKKAETKGKRILIDTRKGSPFGDSALYCMNAGMFANLLEARVQKHVAMVIQNLGVKCIRLSNPFDPELKIRSGHGTEQMNFEKMDTVLDFLLEQDAVPVFELPERQKKMIVSIGSDKRLEEIRTDPVFLSLEEWERALEALMKHLTDRYTAKEVGRWGFEIWYDVEQVTGAGQIPYFLLYERTRSIIKAYAPEAKIGGSGLNTELSRDVLKEQLLWWKDREDRPDFLTFISYPYQVEWDEKKETGKQYSLLSIDSDTHFVKQDMENYYALMRETDYPETPVWVSEWNTSLSERNIYNDSCAKACHMLTQMVDAADRICRMSYWGISDCPSQYFDSAAPLIGATGLITRDALPKPAYYAFEFWKQLGERMLGKGEHYIATSQHGDSVQILTFNAKQFSYGYQLKDEDRLAPGELPFVFRNSHRLELTFALEGMKNGKKKICIYRVGEASGNVLTEWKKLGYANDLLRSEIAYLQKICIPRMEVLYQEVTGGILELDVMLEANEMALILVFSKDYP